MQTVKIISDSTCDLSTELTERFNVDIIPLHIILGDETYSDGVDVTAEQIYDWVDKNKKNPKTAAPSPHEIEEVFRRALEEYQEIVCFSISASMSASNANMHLAAQDLEAEDRIHVIDSANLSTGLGNLVLEAAEMAADGANGSEIEAQMEKQKPLVRSSFLVDTLFYLYRGGRCSGLTALAGETLKLHPKISVVDGEMSAGKKYRGNIDRALMNYVHDLEPELKKAQPHRIFITHSRSNPETELAIYEYLESLNYFEEIDNTLAGGVVTCHCGPGTLGLFYIAGEE